MIQLSAFRTGRSSSCCYLSEHDAAVCTCCRDTSLAIVQAILRWTSEIPSLDIQRNICKGRICVPQHSA